MSQSNDHGGNIACLTRDNCSQLFFVYAGGLGMVEGMGPMAFLQQSGISDRNVAFVRDPNTHYFSKGVSDELPDLDAVLDWHQSHLDANPHIDEVYCVGNSFGGWSALFFGYMLGVKKVWALAPAGTWGLKLLLDMMDDSNGVTEYDIFYSEEEERDKRFAQALKEYPGVQLHERNNHGHMMIRGMMQSGELPNLFPPLKGAA